MHGTLLVAILQAAAVAMAPPTSRRPIVLKLQRIPLQSSSNETHDTANPEPARTKGLLFQQVLGVVPGKPFQFNYPKWKSLQRSGLFSNLTAKSVVHEDGIALEISGTEMSTIYIAPEATVQASLEHPSVSGGVRIVNLPYFLIAKQDQCDALSIFYFSPCRYLSKIKIFEAWVNYLKCSFQKRKAKRMR